MTSNAPNFLIIGTPKAGTTSLFHYIGQHPQVFISPMKEPHFFSWGEMDTRGQFVNKPTHLVRTWDRYLKLFVGAGGRAARGEASTSYLWTPRAAERIAQRLPQCRLIVMLRQPADRAFSQYVHNRQRSTTEAPSFEEALRIERHAIDHDIRPYMRYRTQGMYHEHLSRILAMFPQRQILQHLFEDLVERPAEVVRRTLEFLEVDPAFVPDMSLKYNVSGVPRNTAVGTVLKALKPVRKYLERAVPPRLLSRVGQSILAAPKIDPRTRAALTQEFRQDIERLQELIGRDLSHWLAAPPPVCDESSGPDAQRFDATAGRG